MHSRPVRTRGEPELSRNIFRAGERRRQDAEGRLQALQDSKAQAKKTRRLHAFALRAPALRARSYLPFQRFNPNYQDKKARRAVVRST